MNHLSRGWRLARNRPSATLQHISLPENPDDAHDALMRVAGFRDQRYMGSLRRMTAREGTPDDHALLADLAAKGGFSHHPEHGAAPATGWMASYEAPEGSGIAQVHKVHDITPAHLGEHREAVSRHLKQPDSFQGAWHDSETGDVYLDVSRHFHHKPEAEHFAAQNRQKAIFHLDDFSTHYLDPHQDPDREKDPGSWHERYGQNPTAHPGFHAYAHLYPDTPQQAAARPLPAKGAMAGIPVGPWSNYAQRPVQGPAQYPRLRSVPR